ncbi:MAG: TerC family protein [Planctomycetota bacterium]|nr:TerC family protein [Planctomycetota bacterium]
MLGGFESGDLLIVAMLVVLEGMLSCDNAVVLAALVRNLPKEQQGRALRYGIIGAYGFRILALLAATWVMKIWWIKVAGGAYLCWIGLRALSKADEGPEGGGLKVRKLPYLTAFWSTVVAVELTDMVFSVDSIAAAVALSDKLWVLIAGGLLGILAMRFAAQGFIVLLGRFPRLERAAFVAVALIGFKLVATLPADLAREPYPVLGSYVSAAAYTEEARDSAPGGWHWGEHLSLSPQAPTAPERSVLASGITAELALAEPGLSDDALRSAIHERTEREYERAMAVWQLHLRPLVHIDGVIASIVVALVFGAGFLGRGRPDAPTVAKANRERAKSEPVARP